MSLEKISEVTPLFITVYALSFVVIEYLILFLNNKLSTKYEGVISLISAGLAFFPIFLLNKLVFLAFMFWLYQYSIFDLGLEWYVWVMAWVIQDFTFWAIHWAGHNIRLFWCIHGVHHTPKEMNLTVAFRGSFFDFFLQPNVILWIPLLGFNPFVVIITETVGRIYGIIVHINESWFENKKRLWIENFIILPSAHRVHHSTNHLYLDRNYGETLSVWDRIFGTYQKELENEKPKYGVMKEINSENLLEVQLSEFKSLWQDIKSCPNFIDKLKYLFMPPGWNHLDGGLLAKEIREQAQKSIKK